MSVRRSSLEKRESAWAVPPKMRDYSMGLRRSYPPGPDVATSSGCTGADEMLRRHLACTIR